MRNITKISILTLMTAILILFLLAGCSLNEDEQAILGLWGIDSSDYEGDTDPGVNIYYDFQSDGTVIMTAFTGALGQYGNPLVPTHFDYKVKNSTITMTGLYNMLTMEYEIESGPIGDLMTLKLTSMDISLLPDSINENLDVGLSIPLIRVISYTEKGALNDE